MTFQEMLGGFVERFGSQSALGKAIEMSPSRINKVLKGRDTFDVANCLRLAQATGESPSGVLRTAGKADVAALIEQMFGQSRPPIAPAMTPAQREVIDAWEALPGDVQQHVVVLLRYARDVAIAARRGSRTAEAHKSRRRRQSARPRSQTSRTT